MRNCSRYRSTSARTLLALALFTAGGCLVVKAASFRPEATSTTPQRTLTFADRVAYQRAVEEVYWQHRIWPKENPRPKPSLDEVMSQQQIQQKVQEYLRNSQLLADQWQRPITPEQLQAEMKRIASHTRQPDVLRVLFAALGNDPFVVAECLARPVLSERLIDELHARSNPPAEADSLQSGTAGTETGSSVTTEQSGSGYYLPEVVGSRVQGPTADCIDHWTATSTAGAPDERVQHTAVWTGSEMIVWGGNSNGHDVNSGGRYSPSTDTWIATSNTGAPDARVLHTAMWTGSEMIVWGGSGSGELNNGGRYNPSTDSWVATSTSIAPDARFNHTAVWTGSEMIVWGGRGATSMYLNSGGRYSPSTNSWIPTTNTSAPDGRSEHTAVWDGTAMIVWGGYNGRSDVNTGGRYNPIADSWIATATAGAPEERLDHTAVWTGSEMIVWGGLALRPRIQLNSGARYNPSTDTWVATTNAGAPARRQVHTTVWTGSEMIVWGGANSSGYLHNGGRYNPSTDSWVATTKRGAPAKRAEHTAVWTGTEMIVWGGSSDNTGGRYVPCTEGWVATTTPGAPDGR